MTDANPAPENDTRLSEITKEILFSYPDAETLKLGINKACRRLLVIEFGLAAILDQLPEGFEAETQANAVLISLRQEAEAAENALGRAREVVNDAL